MSNSPLPVAGVPGPTDVGGSHGDEVGLGVAFVGGIGDGTTIGEGDGGGTMGLGLGAVLGAGLGVVVGLGAGLGFTVGLGATLGLGTGLGATLGLGTGLGVTLGLGGQHVKRGEQGKAKLMVEPGPSKLREPSSAPDVNCP